jgi:hypothetical protein
VAPRHVTGAGRRPGAGLLGRLAFGAGPSRRLLERRVARLLGIERPRAAAMLAAAEARLGAAGFAVRSASFLAATAPGARLVPAAARARAVRALVGKLLERPADALFYLEEVPEVQEGPCRGLVEA